MSRRQDDPVALYYLGAATLLDGRPESRALGLSYLRQGIEKGIELYMPIDPALKDLIGHRQ
jgi:hypothetical protein